MTKEKVIYNPKIFDVTSIEEAKKIIVTQIDSLSTQTRWTDETEYLARDISEYFLNINSKDSVIVDFGCGIGRVAKEILKTFKGKILGVDISSSMRHFSKIYIQHDNFEAISTEEFLNRVLDGLRVDGIFAIWVLQQSIKPREDLALLKAAMKPNALFYVLNNKISAVPTNQGWRDNGINIAQTLQEVFQVKTFKQLPLRVTNEKIHRGTFIACGSNKPKHLPQEYYVKLQKAFALYNAKEYQKASEIYAELIQANPLYSDAYNGLAVCQKKLNYNLDDVAVVYAKAIRLDPLNNYLYNNLSNVYKEQNKLHEAIYAMYNALRCDRKNVEHYNSLGSLLAQNKEYKKAFESFNSALKLDPLNSKTTNNMGVLFYDLKMYEKSIEMFEKTLSLDPGYTEVYSNLGAAQNKAKQYDKAIESLKKAIQEHPKSAGAYTNLGNVYNKLAQYKKGASYHAKAIELDPNGYNAYSNIGTSYKNQGLLTKAIESYKKAIELKSDFANAHFDLATTYLTQKNFLDGFREYEWRFKKDEMRSHILKYKNLFDAPKFDGKVDVKNKRVLLHTEQGYGDFIMFAPFIDKFKEKYKCKIILQCRDELKILFENSFTSVDFFYARDTEKVPEFDYQYSLLSLPYLLGISHVDDFPKKIPFLFPRYEDSLVVKKEETKISIGICWSASVTSDSYEDRAFSLEYFKPLIENEKFKVYSLQVGPGKTDISKYGFDDKIIDITDQFTDFNKSAYFINQLDLIISSDTSVVHVAGALNKEVWVACPKYPDWRWSNKENDSYWYPSVRLFRQKSINVWESVFQSIYDTLNRKYKVRMKL